MTNCDIPHGYKGWALYPHYSGLAWSAEEMYRQEPAILTASSVRELHDIIDFLKGDDDEQTFQVHR